MRRFTTLCTVLALATGLCVVLRAGERPVEANIGTIPSGPHHPHKVTGFVAVQGCAPHCPPDRVCPQQCVLQPGDEASVEFHADQLNLGPGQRRPVRAVVSLSRGAQDVIPGFEIFDNETGRTSVTACMIDLN